MKKIVEIISKNAYPITLTKGDEAILIGFNRETGKYGIAEYSLYRAISVEEMVKRIRDSRVPDREPGE